MSDLQALVLDVREDIRGLRSEQHASHDILNAKLDTVVATQSNHEVRLVTVENTHKTAKWVLRGFFSGLAVMLFDMFANHSPRLLTRWFQH